MIHRLGKYTIIERLGEGAMGAVYKAYDEILDRHVAIKTMAEDIKWDPELKLRFYREARSAASLHHPNIVTIHDLGEEGKITYIVMELLEGKELKGIIKEKIPMTLEKKLSVMVQVADGLNHAHSHEIIHRDIKPGNIHVSPIGTVKILDFGIARIPSSDLTRSGVRLGTPIYMSPEQIRAGDYDERSDLFSTGIVFYELLTCVHPFRDKNIAKTLDNILFQTQLPFAEQFPDAPPGLWPVLSKCLAKEPDQRYGNMAEFSRACRDLLEELNEASLEMSKDLQGIVPRLKLAAERPGASPKLGRFFQESEELLRRDERPDYLSLKRLLGELSSESAALEAEAPPTIPKIPPSASPVSPRADPKSAGRSQDPAPRTASEPRGVSGTAASVQVPPPLTPDQMRGRELLKSGQVLMTEGRLEEALEQLREALRLLGPEEELVNALTQTRHLIEERKRAGVTQLLESARRALSAGNFDAAIRQSDEILELEPNRPDAVELLRQAVSERDAERVRQAKREQGEGERSTALKLLADKSFRESLVAFRRARELLGEDTAIRKAMEEAEEGIRQENLRAQLEAELSEAQKLMRAEAFDDARARVRRSQELVPENAEAADLLRRIDRAQQAKRQQLGEREKAAGFKLLAEKKFRKSLDALQRASEILGDDATLRVGIEEAGQAIRADELRAQAQAEVAEARKALGSESFDHARAHAQRALELVSNQDQATDLLAEIDRAQEEKRKKDKIAELIAGGKQALLRDEHEEAGLRAQEVMLLDPQNAQAQDILRRLDDARKEKEKRGKIATLLAESEQALLQEEFQGAAVRAKEVFLLEPKSARAEQLLKRIEEAEALKRRQDQVRLLLSQGQNALTADNLTEAANHAREALRLDTGNVEAANLLQGIEQLREKRKKARINALLSKGRQALSRDDFEEAGRLAQEVISVDSGNADATNLLQGIEEAREKRKRDQIAKLLFECQQARETKKFDEAAGQAQSVLELDPKNKEARSLLKQIQKDARADEKEQARERKRLEKERQAAERTAASPVAAATDPLDETVILPKSTIFGGRVPPVALWAGAAILVIAFAVGGYLRTRNKPTPTPLPDFSMQLADAQSYIEQKNFQRAIEILQQVLQQSPENPEARSLLDAASQKHKEQTIETWLREAQTLRSQGKSEEATQIAGKILQLDPENQGALQIRGELEKRVPPTTSPEDPEKEIEGLLAKIPELLKAKNRVQAKASIDRVLQLRPNDERAVKLQRQWKGEPEKAKVDKTLAAGAQKKKKVGEESYKRASEQFSKGKYAEAQTIIDRWLVDDPQNEQASELQTKTKQALRIKGIYDAHMSEKTYDEALNAVQQLAKINPEDPNVSQMRAAAANKKRSAVATLTIWRLGEPVPISLDGEVLVTTGGEVTSLTIPAGVHKLEVKGTRTASLRRDLIDGQYTFAYDGYNFIRLAEEGDAELRVRRKTREETRKWRVEHSHRFGRCEGELVMNGFQVEYRPDQEKNHGGKWPFPSLKLSVDNRDLELVDARNNKLEKFKAADSNKAKEVKQFWEKLDKLSR